MKAAITNSLERGLPVEPADRQILRIDPASATTAFDDMTSFHDGLIDNPAAPARPAVTCGRDAGICRAPRRREGGSVKARC